MAGKYGGGFGGFGGGFGVITPSMQKGGGYGGKAEFGGKGGGWGLPNLKGDHYGNKGGGKGGWEAPVAATSATKCYNINVGDSALTQQGYGPEAPALVFEKGNDVFSSASHILGECLENPKEDVEIIDDPDWEQFPEIGEAIKAATSEEHCFSIGICASKSKWAIGCGSGYQGRERAVKAALGVAFAMDDLVLAKTLASNYPDFGTVLRKKGLKVGGGGGAAAGGAAAGGWKAKTAGGLGGGLGGDQEWQAPQLSGEAPKTHLISITSDSQLTTEGYPADGPAVVHGGKHEKPYFSNAHSILQDQVEEIEEVTFQDDGDGDQLPELSAALVAAGGEECGFCLATCPSKAVWGIGVAFGAASRKTASKMALAIAIAQADDKIDDLAKNYPEFGEICATVGLYEAPVSKKRRKF